jgi:hypothetical protein
MRLGIILASAFVLCTGLGYSQAAKTTAPSTKTSPSTKTKMKHPHLHHALWALHHANHELHASKENYAGHKQKAEHAIHHAIKAIDAILTHEKDNHHPVPSKAELTEAHKKYKHHPHLHHALHEVKDAHHQVKSSKDDFGGNRAKALHDMDHAAHQIELILKHAHAADKGKSTAKTSVKTAAR